MKKPQILLTNDDGIHSPGLWAAAEALSEIGFVHVVAPRDQSTGMGRSMPNNSDGIIETKKVTIKGKTWTVYAVGGSPAQAIQHGILEVMPETPKIAVSGINYGENLGTGITISGTVGAALEAAALGIPALAVSLETDQAHHLSYSEEVDFSTAARASAFFAKTLLQKRLPPDVDVLKIDVPACATPDTPWMLTRISRKRYYLPTPPDRKSWSETGKPGYRQVKDLENFDHDSDVYVVRVLKQISVTPISLDMTSRIDLESLNQLFGRQAD